MTLTFTKTHYASESNLHDFRGKNTACQNFKNNSLYNIYNLRLLLYKLRKTTLKTVLNIQNLTRSGLRGMDRWKLAKPDHAWYQSTNRLPHDA